MRACADLQRGIDAVAGVVLGAAHAAQVPARTEVAHAHLGVGFKAAAGQHHGLGHDVLIAVRTESAHAGHRAAVVLDQVAHAGFVADGDAHALAGLDQHVDQAPAAADSLDVYAAIEVVLALDLERLPAEHWDEADLVRAHPAHGLTRLADQDAGEILVRLMVGDPHQNFHELLFGERRQVADGFVFARSHVIEDVGAQVLDAVVAEAEAAGRESRVAAAILLGRLFQHQHLHTLLGG